jgi:hypothetical protein
LIFTKNGLGYSLGDFSQTHLVARLSTKVLPVSLPSPGILLYVLTSTSKLSLKYWGPCLTSPLVPRGEICPLGECSPLRSPPGVNTRRM